MEGEFGIPGFRRTPPEMLEAMYEVWLRERAKVVATPLVRALDPGAGTGEMVQFLLDNFPGVHVTAIEIDNMLQGILRGRFKNRKDVEVIYDDFFTTPGQEGRYDLIFMSPPSENDIAHVVRAYHCLASRGILVAVMSAMWTHRKDEPAVEFINACADLKRKEGRFNWYIVQGVLVNEDIEDRRMGILTLRGKWRSVMK